MPDVLAYETRGAAPKSLTLINDGGEVRLIFPNVPKWLQLIGIAFTALAALAAALLIMQISWMILWLRRNVFAGTTMPAISQFDMFSSFWPHLIPLLFWSAIAIYEIMEFQRWGHVPNSLALRENRLIWRRRGFWGMKERTFPAEQITGVSIERVPDIFRRNRAFKIRIDFASRRPFSHRFSTSDPELPTRIANAFRAALGIAGESRNPKESTPGH